MVDGMELDHFLEEGEAAIANLCIWKVRHRGTPSIRWLANDFLLASGTTHGHEIMETSKMPTIIALLALYAIRYAVTMPPAMIPNHI
jgi:hypothetical protein